MAVQTKMQKKLLKFRRPELMCCSLKKYAAHQYVWFFFGARAGLGACRMLHWVHTLKHN
jgi:hypothetical protein